MAVVGVPESEFAPLKIAIAVNMGEGWYWAGTDSKHKGNAPEGFMPIPEGWQVLDRRDSDDVVQVKKEMRQDFVQDLGRRLHYAREEGDETLVATLENLINNWKPWDEER